MNDSHQSIEQECSELARAIAPLVLQELHLTAEDTPHGKALGAAVYRAVDQLEGQGARSQRIALQLLEALARYELALGQLLIAEESTMPGYDSHGECDECGKHGPLQCLTTQEDDRHPVLVCLDGHEGLTLPKYTIQWCNWQDGFGADQQDWRGSDHVYTDQYDANTMRERLDNQFRKISIRHRVVEVKT